MKPPVFLDTAYVLALANPRDRLHRAAVEQSSRTGPSVVTTDAVLVEIADALCRASARTKAAQVIDTLRDDPAIECVPMSRALFDSGYALYRARHDKDWSLTDCISFAVMQKRGMAEALTSDRHFAQAGFTALLR